MPTPPPPAASVRIRLLNRQMSHGAGPVALKGYSQRAYGSISRFSPADNCHVVELTLEAYEAARADLFKAMRLHARRIWEVAVVTDFTAEAPRRGEVEEAQKRIMEEGNPEATTKQDLPGAGAFPEVSDKTPWNELQKIGKAEGVDLKQHKNKPSLLAAIHVNRSRLHAKWEAPQVRIAASAPPPRPEATQPIQSPPPPAPMSYGSGGPRVLAHGRVDSPVDRSFRLWVNVVTDEEIYVSSEGKGGWKRVESDTIFFVSVGHAAQKSSEWFDANGFVITAETSRGEGARNIKQAAAV